MRTIHNPGQTELFDPWTSKLSDTAYNRLSKSFYAVFRHTILELMPADKLGDKFHEDLGRPSKELHAMAGLILLKEFKNWTTAEAVDQYMFNVQIHYALNIPSHNASISEKTVERYMELLREDGVAGEIFDSVTGYLIKSLDIEVDKQRLDSTHVFSDMATFSRTKLMIKTIKRFLVQLKKHHSTTFATLGEKFQKLCKKDDNALFYGASKDASTRILIRQEAAEMMNELIVFFSCNSNVLNMTTFKHLVTVFNQQCEVVQKNKVSDDDSDLSGGLGDKKNESEVVIKKKTGGDVIQNTSDLEATYDGHKGQGYQVQLSETSNSDNEIQLITDVQPESAVKSDADSLETVLESLKRKGLNPSELTADTLYGGDDNERFSHNENCQLISPVSGAPTKNKPVAPNEKQQRLQKRRDEEKTDEWKKKYKTRAQIEGTIGCIKRKTGLSQLRYRGKKSVFCSMILKVIGWNISMSVRSKKMQRKVKEALGTVVSSVYNVRVVFSRLFKTEYHNEKRKFPRFEKIIILG